LVADFEGGEITSDAGGLLLREADRRLGLTEALSACIPDRRQDSKTRHSILEMVRQRVYGIALGYEDLNDHDHLRHDELMKVAVEEDHALASSPTLCRFENGVGRASLSAMAEVFVERFIASFRTPPKELILDFDATDDTVHGSQEGRFFHGYYDSYCFLPLYVFCGDKLLVARLRPSNIDASKHAWGILSLLVRRFRREWPEVRIVLRADSGFARWKMMRWCDRNDVGYIVGLARNARLARASAPWREEAQVAFDATRVKQRIFGEFSYAADTWDVERRVVVKAEHGVQGANPRYVVTNLEGDPEALYDRLYVKRGEMENRIKEQQLHLFADRTSAHDFEANQLRLLLAGAAYVLVEFIRSAALAGTELARAQCDTLRLKLLKIGARIVRSVRRVMLHLAGGYPYRDVLAHAVRQLVPT
jgi:hypothetical protein